MARPRTMTDYLAQKVGGATGTLGKGLGGFLAGGVGADAGGFVAGKMGEGAVRVVGGAGEVMQEMAKREHQVRTDEQLSGRHRMEA